MTGRPVVGAEEKGHSLGSILCCWSRSNNFPPLCTVSCQTRSQWSTCKWSQASSAWRTCVEAEVGWWYLMQSWSLQTGSWQRFQVQWLPFASGFKICPEWLDDNWTPLRVYRCLSMRLKWPLVIRSHSPTLYAKTQAFLIFSSTFFSPGKETLDVGNLRPEAVISIHFYKIDRPDLLWKVMFQTVYNYQRNHDSVSS